LLLLVVAVVVLLLLLLLKALGEGEVGALKDGQATVGWSSEDRVSLGAD